jgi:hypothetical protein
MAKVKTTKFQMLRRDFEIICMKENESIDSFYTQVIGVVNQIRSHKENLEDTRIVEKILRSLHTKILLVVVAIEETNNLS